MQGINMASSEYLCLALAVCCMTLTCNGFNIDSRFPVVKDGKTIGSFFGFSVALHKQTDGSNKYLLLAGAPKDKAVSLRNVNETGAIYSCPITTDLNDCARMDLVSSTDSTEMVEGMWLGVTVASQRDLPGGRVLACGHRYVKVLQGGTEEQRRMVGKCYVRGNDLTYDPNDEWQAYSYELCNPNYDMELEGLCNIGISGGITDTDVYLGSVGSYLWQGNVHVVWRNPDPGNTWDSSEKDFGQLDSRNSYMGYSVFEDRKLLSRDDITVVTGAPRNESIGSVTLAKKGNTNLVPEVVILGEQLGSYFGNSLAVTDLNNDDWNDLIVSAPFYFDRKEEVGGAVYVFMNENGSFQSSPSMVLKGPTASGFGFAVAAIGDVNQDGFQDFAVGAPFHESGKLYIWMGSKQGIAKEPSQVIEGKSVGSGGFQTFGYSISGGMDMDENSYPDILVGSLDDRIALLRARPVIHLFKNFTVQPKIVDPNACPPNNKPCVTVTVCFSYTLSNGKTNFKKDINVKYTVEADKDRRSPRVRFLDNNPYTYTGVLTLPSPNIECEVLELRVEDNVRDKLEPVVFFLNVSLNEEKFKVRKVLQNLDSYPVLSQKQKVTEKTVINFKKQCGTDNKCTSNLQLTAEFADDKLRPYPRKAFQQVLNYISSVKKIMLLVYVTNLPNPRKVAEDAHQAMLNITIPSTLRYSGVRSPDPEVVCRAEETVICDLGNPLKSNKKVSLTLILETAGISLQTREIECQLLLSTLSEQNDLYPVSVPLLVENTIQTSFSIENSLVQTHFSGEVMGESAMKTTRDVGSPVEFTFKVSVEGQPLGALGTLAVEFEWPHEVTNGKWLLYLTEIVTVGTAETNCNPPGIVNLLNLTMPEKSSKRHRRGVDDQPPNIIEVQAISTGLSPRKETYKLECSLGTAHCVTFTCPLVNMSSSAKIIVRARVWNSTLLEDYKNALRIEVIGRAALKLVTDSSNINMERETREFRIDIDPVLGVEQPYEVPLWIIIVAVLAGILLLGVISIILWKCGFFRRANRREMYEAKGQKAEMKTQPSETERLTEDY
ncbi:integrin alpha-3b [Esox lucius]|uniref:Integrin alpha-2 domain-containing protein n=1 Tax=Esox lucius TaxID=8010 RepID=A0A3P8ZYR8_ESOLU|nr:integrin alpha-3b [Esox lucius]